MEGKQNKKVLKVIIILFDIFFFLACDFVLTCFQYSYRADFYASFALRAINMLIYYRFFFLLRNNLFQKAKKFPAPADILLIVAMWLVSSAICYIFVNTFGYFEISLVLGR